MISWQTMDAWRSSEGPKNGTLLLVLSPDGDRRLASFRGYSQRWLCDTTANPLDWSPVAWASVPDVPQELIQRRSAIEALRKELSARETAPLALR